jgi:hypothetical protein
LTDPLDEACSRLETHLPRRIRHVFQWARSPRAKFVRLPLGILCLLGGLLWFLPLVGLWMLPLGLVLLAQDIAFMRRPVARLMSWLLDRWERRKARRRVSA